MSESAASILRNLSCRTASVCFALALLGKVPVNAQDAVATPQEEERAREALRAGLDNSAARLPSFDRQPAGEWDIQPAVDIAPGLHANLFLPWTEIAAPAAYGDWLPGSAPWPEQDRAAVAETPAQDSAEPPSHGPKKTPESRAARKKQPVLRSGRASLVEKTDPDKAANTKPRRKPESAAPRAPVLVLPGELRP